MFFSFNSLESHVKLREISLVTFKTNNLMFSLFGLTDISRHFFKLNHLMILSLVKGEAVAVSAKNGTCFGKKDLISTTRPHHFLNCSFPSFFSPLKRPDKWFEAKEQCSTEIILSYLSTMQAAKMICSCYCINILEWPYNHKILNNSKNTIRNENVHNFV